MDMPPDPQLSARTRSGSQRSYWGLEWAAGSLAFALALASMLLFMMNTVADRVGALIEAQNAAALHLSDNLDYFRTHQAAAGDASMPPGLFSDVVEFSRNTAIIMQEIHSLSFRNILGLGAPVPAGVSWTDQLLTRLRPKDEAKDSPRHTTFDHTGVDPRTDGKTIVEAGAYQIELYQAIRDYSQEQCTSLKDRGGAVATYLLPLLYALLGACLSALRACRQRTHTRNAGSVPLASSRYAMAIIAGVLISTCSALIPTSLSLPPLAIAFLLGYSIDIFTRSLDGLIARLTERG